MRAFIVVVLCAAPLLGGCTQDENASNSDRDTHMSSGRMAELPPPLPQVVAAAVPVPVQPAASASAAPGAPAADAAPPASAAAPGAAPAPPPAKHR